MPAKNFYVECPRCAYKKALMSIDVDNIPKDLKTEAEKTQAMVDHTVVLCPKCGHNNQQEGFGCFLICNKVGKAIGVITAYPLSDATRKEFEGMFADPNTDSKESYVMTYNPETKEFKLEFGTFPPASETFDAPAGHQCGGEGCPDCQKKE